MNDATSETNMRPPMGPPVMGFQDPPDFDGRVGTPWVTVGLIVLVAMAVAFAGGTGFGYSLARGKAANGAVAPGKSDAELASATASMVQTLRSQIELYRLQHLDKYPTLAQLHDNWSVLMKSTNAKGSFVIGGKSPTYGPYIQSPPINPLNGKSNLCALGAPMADAGWAYNPAKGEIKAVAPAGSAGDSMPNEIVVHVGH